MIAINITHDDDNAVGLLAMAMVTKLAKARAKGRSGWDTPECTQQHLSDLLREHVAKGDPVDVANFCAFLTARGEGIAPEHPAHCPHCGVFSDSPASHPRTAAPAAPVGDLAQLVKRLVRALRKAAPGNDLADKALDYLKRQGLQGSPLRAAPEASTTHAGLLAAAAHIQAKAQAHAEECGSYDPDTGAVEMSNSNQEHFNTLDELAEEIRLMANKATPGYGGPCAAGPAAPTAPAATIFHDAGAIAQCTCGRYTLDRNALSQRDDRRPVCECGTNHGWSGSFRMPGPCAKWHGPAPALPAASAAPEVGAETAKKAARYDFLRSRDLSTIEFGGVFAGRTPDNVVLNGDDLDAAIDAAMATTAQKAK